MFSNAPAIPVTARRFSHEKPHAAQTNPPPAFSTSLAGLDEDTVFCVNQGTREERLQALLDCVRKVYASALSEKALHYRVRRGLLDRDEQMALLVMRVSGA